MNVIIRWTAFFAMISLSIVAFAQSEASARKTGASDLPVCSANEPRELTDESARWRLRAYQNLDCLISKVEQAMDRATGTEKDTVKLSREEAEQLRTLAWWAKDAAARIGR
jgi:hypothetical protein